MGIAATEGGETAGACGSAFGAAAGASAGLALAGAAGFKKKKRERERCHWDCLKGKATKLQILRRI